jgi:hypothetical protein
MSKKNGSQMKNSTQSKIISQKSNRDSNYTKISFRSFGNDKTKEARKIISNKPVNSFNSKEHLTLNNWYPNMKNKISPEIRMKIATILHVDPTDAFDVPSCIESEGLYLVHYTEGADLDKLGWIRGILVDINAMCIKAMPFGVTPWITLDEIVPNSKGDFNCLDENGNNLVLNINNLDISEGIEGCQVTTVWHNSKFYLITRKNIFAYKFRRPCWKVTAGEAWDKLEGPHEFELYDISKKHSPFSHTFILAYPEYLIATRKDFGPGIISYGGFVQNFPLDESCPYKHEEVDDTIHLPNMEKEMPDIIFEPFIYDGKKLSVEEANHFLRYGWLDKYEDSIDIRLRSGEFLFVFDRITNNCYQIASTA